MSQALYYHNLICGALLEESKLLEVLVHVPLHAAEVPASSVPNFGKERPTTLSEQHGDQAQKALNSV